jgi:outer membrane biosynthesis protein TonB
MRRTRSLQIVLALAVGATLAGCESFDPTDMFNQKKPLPGDRRAVFPEGVPGVPQGVPKELVQGYQPPAEPAPAPPLEAEKPKPKPKRVAQPAPRPPRPSSAQPAQLQVSPTSGQPPQPQQQAAPWPAPQQAPQQTSQSPFPDPPAPGTFQR